MLNLLKGSHLSLASSFFECFSRSQRVQLRSLSCPYSLVDKLKMATTYLSWLSLTLLAILCHKTVKVGRRLCPIFLGYASYKPRVLLGSRYTNETRLAFASEILT